MENIKRLKAANYFRKKAPSRISDCNQFHNILRLAVFTNFPFIASETLAIITYKHGVYDLPNVLSLSILGN